MLFFLIILKPVVIYLRWQLPATSSDLPEDRPGVLISSYSVLLLMGFAQPTSHLVAGELLPRHFTLAMQPIWRMAVCFCGTFRRSPLLGITQHPARWSSDFPQAIRPATTRFTWSLPCYYDTMGGIQNQTPDFFRADCASLCATSFSFREALDML